MALHGTGARAPTYVYSAPPPLYPLPPSYPLLSPITLPQPFLTISYLPHSPPLLPPTAIHPLILSPHLQSPLTFSPFHSHIFSPLLSDTQPPPSTHTIQTPTFIHSHTDYPSPTLSSTIHSPPPSRPSTIPSPLLPHQLPPPSPPTNYFPTSFSITYLLPPPPSTPPTRRCSDRRNVGKCMVSFRESRGFRLPDKSRSQHE